MFGKGPGEFGSDVVLIVLLSKRALCMASWHGTEDSGDTIKINMQFVMIHVRTYEMSGIGIGIHRK